MSSFLTASGKNTTISEQALAKARKLFDSVELEASGPPESIQPSFSGFSTAKGEAVTVSAESVAKAAKLFESVDKDYQVVNVDGPLVQPSHLVPDDLMLELERDVANDFPSSSNNLNARNQSAASSYSFKSPLSVKKGVADGNVEGVNRPNPNMFIVPSHNKCPPSTIQNQNSKCVTRSFAGFSTGTGAAVSVSASSIAQAGKLFESIETDYLNGSIVEDTNNKPIAIVKPTFSAAKSTPVSVTSNSVPKTAQLCNRVEKNVPPAPAKCDSLSEDQMKELETDAANDAPVLTKKFKTPVFSNAPTFKPPMSVRPVAQTFQDNTTDYCNVSKVRSIESSTENRLSPDNINPIISLSPYQNRWTIRARVGQKSDIKKYKNAKGPGELFSVDLIDNSGEIRATAFNEDCKRLYSILTPKAILYISGGRIKSANKKFTTIKNDYEITFDKSTEATPCLDDSAANEIPSFCFNFTKINNLASLPEGGVVDVIGVVKAVGDLDTITTSDKRQLEHRKVVLVDRDANSNAPVDITLTLWANQATEFTGVEASIVALKNVRMNGYQGGKSLSANQGTGIHVDPDIPNCVEMRMWYDYEGRLLDPAMSLSAKQSDNTVPDCNCWIPIEAANIAYESSDDSVSEYFNVKGVVTFLKHDTCLYKGCPGDGCKKKVVDNGSGLYTCEKCGQQFDTYKYNLMLSACITDFSGQKWVTLFSETAEKLVGVATDQLAHMKDASPDAFLNVFEKVTHKPFQFRIASKGDNLNVDQRARWTVISVTPLNVVEYTNYLNTQSQLLEAQ